MLMLVQCMPCTPCRRPCLLVPVRVAVKKAPSADHLSVVHHLHAGEERMLSGPTYSTALTYADMEESAHIHILLSSSLKDGVRTQPNGYQPHSMNVGILQSPLPPAPMSAP